MTPQEYFLNVEKAIVNANIAYWITLKPETMDDNLRRWLFAFLSIHTTWRSNVKGYNAVKNLSWINNKNILREALKISGVGLHNNRTNYIWDFKNKFQSDPTFYYKSEEESWTEYRNRLTLDIKGLGYAKTSFGVFLNYPESDVVCLDVHLLRALGANTKTYSNKLTYESYEDKWKNICNNKYPGILREIYWNHLQGERDSIYWSECFHK
jgi:thermostable 8-oxoguanine DNA glycosylase